MARAKGECAIAVAYGAEAAEASSAALQIALSPWARAMACAEEELAIAAAYELFHEPKKIPMYLYIYI
jgi:hypothetical protein